AWQFTRPGCISDPSPGLRIAAGFVPDPGEMIMNRLPFVGRSEELAAMDAALHDTARGAGRVLVVEGEPGIGKSRLLDEALGGSHRCAVLRGAAGDELCRDRPLGVLRTALRDAAPVSDAATGPGETGFLLVAALAEELERRAATDPVVLVLEDVQWGDVATLRALPALARRLAGTAFTLVVTVRTPPRPPHLDHLVDRLVGTGGRLLPPGPLAGAGVTGLAASVLGCAPGRALRQRVAAAGGNPLFLIELLDALAEEGAVDAAGELVGAGPVLPASVRQAVLRRLSHLDGRGAGHAPGRRRARRLVQPGGAGLRHRPVRGGSRAGAGGGGPRRAAGGRAGRRPRGGAASVPACGDPRVDLPQPARRRARRPAPRGRRGAGRGRRPSRRGGRAARAGSPPRGR